MKNLESLGTFLVILILGDSIIKDVKGWELTDESNKVVVKYFLWVYLFIYLFIYLLKFNLC